MNSMATLDGDKLKKIANASHTAQVIVNALSERQRLRHTSDIQRTKNALIRSGERIVESDYEQFWEDIQAAGAGSIIYGRNGRQDDFKWHYSLKNVSKAMLDGKDVKAEKLSLLNSDLKKEIKSTKTVLRKSTPKALLTAKQDEEKMGTFRAVKNNHGDSMVYVLLRPDFEVEFKVPSDLTKEEVEVLTRALTRRAV